MRVGIVSYWFNRGQAVVARHLRSALDELGHETFVLARPTRDTNIRPSHIERDGVWEQPRITEASNYYVPGDEYERWTSENGIEIAFFDQNYQFAEIARLRAAGVRTLARFVWEAFSPDHVAEAREALDVVYSLTACERERYAGFGIESPRVRWGCHPELFEVAPIRNDDSVVTFFYPGGFMTRRKPFEAVLEAFMATDDPKLRLVLKAQVERKAKRVRRTIGGDERVEQITDDLPTAEHLGRFAGSDVCLAPSRWEGLGLHLFEATAFGLPTITNDNPPMNEVVTDGENGILVRGIETEEPAKSGIPAYDPDVGQMREAIERLADPGERERLAAGARAARERFRWERTVEDLGALLERVPTPTGSGASRAGG
jgi:glycosyltransferase involved in cell wall biosynthesis